MDRFYVIPFIESVKNSQSMEKERLMALGVRSGDRRNRISKLRKLF